MLESKSGKSLWTFQRLRSSAIPAGSVLVVGESYKLYEAYL